MDNERIEPRELEVPEKPAPGRESTPRRIARRQIGRHIWMPTFAERKARSAA